MQLNLDIHQELLIVNFAGGGGSCTGIEMALGRRVGQIERVGRVNFTDAGLAVWEEGISEARSAGGMNGARNWELQFKRDVFKRVIQTLNRLGWSVTMPEIDPHDVMHYGGNVARWASERRRLCSKGDLKADLEISGRHIELKMFQSINCPTRPDHEGRYEWNKEACMPYVIRLEMERTRRRIRDYLCNVFSGYTFKPSKISSPNPDPLVFFNDGWDGEYEKTRGTHRFDRGADGWPSDKELGSWNRIDKDGVRLNHGAVRWFRDDKGRLLRGRVYGGINGQWLCVYGTGKKDYTHKSANEFFTYREGETKFKEPDTRIRAKRLSSELDKAIKSMSFERAAVLRDVLYTKGVSKPTSEAANV